MESKLKLVLKLLTMKDSTITYDYIKDKKNYIFGVFLTINGGDKASEVEIPLFYITEEALKDSKPEDISAFIHRNLQLLLKVNKDKRYMIKTPLIIEEIPKDTYGKK